MSSPNSQRVVIVTGGSRGIGRATSLLLAVQGFKIVVAYGNRVDAANDVRDEITARGGTALTFKVDIAQENDVVALFKAADSFGKVWGLVNSAGIVAPDARVDDMSAARLAEVFAINVVGYFLCCREAVKRMSTKYGGEGGSIVNVSSMQSVHGGFGRAVDYGASKAAIDTLTIGLAREVAAESIRVNCVRPAGVRTDFLKLDQNPERLETIERGIPLGRLGEPVELAKAISFLLTEDSSFTTGAILNVSGGR